MAKIHRFIEDFKLAGDQSEVIISSVDTLNQWRNTLRFKKGDLVELINPGDKIRIIGEILFLSKEEARVKVIENLPFIELNQRNLSLCCAVLKKSNFELVVQKAVEIGVKEIVPAITERTVKQNLNHDRLEKIAKEAIEQSGQVDLPEIKKPISLEEVFDNFNDKYLKIFCDFTGQDIAKINKENIQDIVVVIGPEGGFTQKEKELALRNNFKEIKLGPSVLRAETAAIVASFYLLN